MMYWNLKTIEPNYDVKPYWDGWNIECLVMSKMNQNETSYLRAPAIFYEWFHNLPIHSYIERKNMT